MQEQVFLAGVMDAYIFNGAGELILSSKALTNSSISLGITAEEIRAGKGAKLIGRFFHSSTFNVTLEDALFQLDYIGYNVGASPVEAFGNFTQEQVVATSGGLTVTGTPMEFLGLGTVGYYAPVGTEDWQKVEFTGSTAVVTGLTAGDLYCVKYFSNVPCRELTVPADFVPDEVTLLLKGDLYKASKGGDISTSSKVGYVEVEVPRFQMDGNMEINLEMTGASQTSLTGQALAATSEVGCESSGYYAKIRDIRVGANWYDDLKALAVAPSDTIELEEGETTTLEIYGVFSGNKASRKIDNTLLTFTIDEGTSASVSTTGVVTTTTTGDTLVTTKVTGATGSAANVDAQIMITVS